MTAKQAAAYAQLIADGILGKASILDSDSREAVIYDYVEDSSVFWDLPFTVLGYEGRYETTRSYAVLGDFAGDGNPYLYVFDKEKEDSFSIYGWHRQKATLLVNMEDWRGRSGAGFSADPATGVVTLSIGGSMGAASHGGSEYSFRKGDMHLSNYWEETYDYDRDLMVVTDQGEVTTYTMDEWYAYLEEDPIGAPTPEKQYPWKTPDETIADGCTIQEMLSHLNSYASALSDGQAAPIETPERPERMSMAREMLRVINDSYDLGYAKLLDMDGDGTRELIIVTNKDIPACTIYQWSNGRLTANVDDTGSGLITDTLSLVRHVDSGQYAVVAVQYTGHTEHRYYFPDHVEQLWLGNYVDVFDVRWYHNEKEISESEYAAMMAKYETVDEIITLEHITANLAVVNSHIIEETKAELQGMLV